MMQLYVEMSGRPILLNVDCKFLATDRALVKPPPVTPSPRTNASHGKLHDHIRARFHIVGGLSVTMDKLWPSK